MTVSFGILNTLLMLRSQLSLGTSSMLLQCGAPKIAKLVPITPISLWFMVHK